MYNAGLALSRHFREEFSRHRDGRSPADQNLYAQLAPNELIASLIHEAHKYFAINPEHAISMRLGGWNRFRLIAAESWHRNRLNDGCQLGTGN
jgi:hypothetical protein